MATTTAFSIKYDPSTTTLQESRRGWIIGKFDVQPAGKDDLHLIKDGWFITVNKDRFIKAIQRWQQTSRVDFVAEQTELYVQVNRNGFVEAADIRKQ